MTAVIKHEPQPNYDRGHSWVDAPTNEILGAREVETLRQKMKLRRPMLCDRGCEPRANCAMEEFLYQGYRFGEYDLKQSGGQAPL